jgi:hypothetical protein
MRWAAMARAAYTLACTQGRSADRFRSVFAWLGRPVEPHALLQGNLINTIDYYLVCKSLARTDAYKSKEAGLGLGLN